MKGDCKKICGKQFAWSIWLRLIKTPLPIWRLLEKLKLVVKQWYQKTDMSILKEDKNRRKIPKLKHSSETLWIIFKQCESPPPLFRRPHISTKCRYVIHSCVFINVAPPTKIGKLWGTAHRNWCHHIASDRTAFRALIRDRMWWSELDTICLIWKTLFASRDDRGFYFKVPWRK